MSNSPVLGRSIPAPPAARLGEELPVFCERCGYSLHGLPPVRCEHCEILHHRCPECGHTQPINTLRPAFQRILGRMRAAGLAWNVLFKINFFGWLLFAWGAMGYEWSYEIQNRSFRAPAIVTTPGRPTAPASAFATTPGRGRPSPLPPQRPSYNAIVRPIDLESILAFSILGAAFGLVGRMLLLRWRRGQWVGLILAVAVAICIVAGAYLHQRELLSRTGIMGWGPIVVQSPFNTSFAMLVAIAMLCILAAAMLVWSIWSGLVRLLLPPQTASALLAWQRGLSASVSGLARE